MPRVFAFTHERDRMIGSFKGFIGQKQTVNYLKSQLAGAQALGQPCPHILVLGPSGMGKTKLIKALSLEAGVNCRIVHGKASPKDICFELVQLEKYDFLFLDEAHTLPRESQEALYEVIDSGIATNKVSQNKIAAIGKTPTTNKDGKLVVQSVTIALATNEPSGLLEALLRRMELTVLLADYQTEELIDIAAQTAVVEKLLFNSAALKRVAVSSLGQPRTVVQTVKGMRRLFYNDNMRQLTNKDVLVYLKTTGRDKDGLGQEQRKYLKRLHALGHASLQTIASLLGLEPAYAEQKVEVGLVKLGLVYKGAGGRRLTKEGEQWVRDFIERKQIKEAKKKENV